MFVKAKTILLARGSEEGYGWGLTLRTHGNIQNFCGSFNMDSEERKYKGQIRARDRKWAKRAFSRQCLKQYEIHHEWERGEVVSFLTHVEHKRRDKLCRSQNQKLNFA